MNTVERILKDPVKTAETAPFWDAAKEGRFLVKRCKTTGRSFWYPRTYSPFVAGGETEWVEASGEGVIYSYSVMRRAKPSYVMAYVTLDEGPTMMTNIVDCDPDSLNIGDRVTVVFKSTEGGDELPMFTPKLGDKE
jgi:uncharacterized OB-fold protein